ncbi:MAG: MFS transporter [Streptosporangiaceae bacterium]
MTTESRQRYGDAFAVPEFRVIFAAHVISFLGLVVADFATTVLIFQRTGSPLLTALVFTLAFAPHLFAGAFAGALVDRVPARSLLVACDLAIATIAAVMAIPGMPVAALLALVFLMGMTGPILSGTRAATLREILPGPAYVPGRSLVRLVAQGGQVAGLGLGGLLLTGVRPQAALLIESAAALLSAALLRFGTTERQVTGASGGGSLVSDSIGGLREVLSVRPLRRILLFGWFIAALSVAPEALANPYAHEQGFSTAKLGLIMAVLPLGCVLGEFAVMKALTPRRQVRVITPLAVCTVAPLVLYGLEPGFFAVMAILLVSGAGVGYHLGQDHLVLEITPERLLSRALALQSAGLMFWQGIGFALAGAVGQFVSVSGVVAGAGVTGLVAIVLLRGRDASR